MEEKMKHTNNRGPTAPFWEIRGGSADHHTADTMAQPPSVAMVGSAVESGRLTRKESRLKKRTHWVLEKQAPSQEEGKGKLVIGDSRKQGKSRGNPGGRIQDIRRYFEGKGRGSAPSLESGWEEGKDNGTQSGPL